MTAIPPSEALHPIESARVVGATTYLETYVDHPEGVAVARDGTIYASGEDGQIYRVQPDETDVDLLASTGGSTLGVTLSSDERILYVCDFQRHALFRLPLDGSPSERQLEIELQGGEDKSPIQPNFCAFDTSGRLFLSDSGDRRVSGPESGGCILYRDTDREWHTLTERVSCWTNGLALSRDEKTLYVVESHREQLWALTLSDTEVENATVIADSLGILDGVALDADDRLYVTSTSHDAIYRLDEETVELVVHDPTSQILCRPTNVAFGGPEMRTLYIAQLGLPHLTAVDLDSVGRYPTARV